MNASFFEVVLVVVLNSESIRPIDKTSCKIDSTWINFIPMDAITYSAPRANLASTISRVCNDHEALITISSDDQSVVMISLEDYSVLEETAYLLRSPTNAKRSLSAIE
jgi:antitoxin YefM